MAQDTSTRVVGIFDNRREAVSAVKALMAAGFSTAQILVVARDWKGDELPGPKVELQQVAADGAVTGAVAGAGVGAIAGGLAALLPVAGVGILILGALGIAAGATIGSYVGPFLALEMTESEAMKHAEQVQQGRIVVLVRTKDRHDEANQILVEHGAYDFSMTNEP
jgi:hypothetical protein